MENRLLDIDHDRIFSYRYGRYLSNGSLVIAVVAILSGLFLSIKNFGFDLTFTLLGLILVGLGILAFIPVELFQVNFRTKEYRVCVRFFNHYKGKWKPLSSVQYLSIVTQRKTIYMSRPSLLGSAVEHNVQDCNLRFFIKAGYYIDIDDFNKKEEAIKFGKMIADGLELKLLDATIRPPEFVE